MTATTRAGTRIVPGALPRLETDGNRHPALVADLCPGARAAWVYVLDDISDLTGPRIQRVSVGRLSDG